jgi:hypothetical protein
MKYIYFLIPVFFLSTNSLQIHAQVNRETVSLIINPVIKINSKLPKAIVSFASQEAASYKMFANYLENNKNFKVVSREQTELSIKEVEKIYLKMGKSSKDWIEYVNKMKESSIGIGANYLVIIDELTIIDETFYKTYYTFTMVQVQTNKLYKFTIEPETQLNMTSTKEELESAAKKEAVEVLIGLGKAIDWYWPILWNPKEIKKSSITANPAVNTNINKGDIVHWYSWSEKRLGEKNDDLFYRIEDLGESEILGVSGDKTSVEMKIKINDSKYNPSNLIGQTSTNVYLSNTRTLQLSYVELDEIKENSEFIRFDINSKIYESINSNNTFLLFQSQNKDLVYKEKNIQKSEEYLNGNSIDQYKSNKGQYVLFAADLGSNFNEYNITLRVVDGSTGIVEKEKTIISKPSNFSKEVSNFLKEIFMTECRIASVSKNEVQIFSTINLNISSEDVISILDWKEMNLGGKTVKVREPIAQLEFEKKEGQLYTLKLKKVINDSFNNFSESKIYYIAIDGK